jgi:hypothetical protein
LWWAFAALERFDSWKIPTGSWRQGLERNVRGTVREMLDAMRGPLMISVGLTFALSLPFFVFGPSLHPGVVRRGFLVAGATLIALPVAAMTVMYAWRATFVYGKRGHRLSLTPETVETLIRRGWFPTWLVAITFGGVLGVVIR